METNNTQQATYTFIPNDQQAAAERELAAIRRCVFEMTDAEYASASARMDYLKSLCAANWDARRNQHKGERLTRMGY